ncbi:PAS domain-containing protein [Rubrobacter marinus]|uniref:histidine kinase n=1 Tax=Rubrobacter marinus TaxID=2653852 RepID=A0A6G8PUH3_9ACTN|nr:HAMP domain-containing sensor histidine kinase [Rubrobacter marinus]QIN77651.1 PAS domain-containing protein [Rubrobacter marinus]
MDYPEFFARATLDGLSAHVAIVDGSGTIVAVNRAWREFAEANGAAVNVSEGANYLRVCDSASDHDEEAGVFAEGLRAILSGERERFAREYPCHAPNERRWFVGRVTRFPNHGPPRAVVAHEDVTERRLALDALAEALRSKEEFLADAAHELKTPLTVIRGNAEVGLSMRHGCAHEEILREIVEESGRMSQTVEGLLLLARSDSASVPLEARVVDVAPFLEGLARRAGALARERGISLRADLRAEETLRCEPTRIEQAVLILVDNAAKYGFSPEPISLSSETGSGELRVEVADRGPGIPEGELPRIFERFYRIDAPRASERGGVGLGLPIARAIAEAHGGRIEAESRVGEGTTMRICLPLSGDPQPKLDRRAV